MCLPFRLFCPRLLNNVSIMYVFPQE
ncbi:hypothetical protein NQ317_001501 [Molorchus minor]|uniref:Uncharacterized protein n=1 Tax=Molorchus minor TaxID=1323400 RepID=A0ABQ9JXV8_9CUCU|nr:hypothetical protein NQ317_001501 [Molorchus minor]